MQEEEVFLQGLRNKIFGAKPTCYRQPALSESNVGMETFLTSGKNVDISFGGTPPPSSGLKYLREVLLYTPPPPLRVHPTPLNV